MTKIEQVIEHCEIKRVSFALIETTEKGVERFCALWGDPNRYDLTPGAVLMVDCIPMGKAMRQIKNCAWGNEFAQGKIILTTEPTAKKRYEAMVKNAEFVTFRVEK